MGSCLSFKKLRPLSGWPAGTLLLTKGTAFFFAASAAVAFASGLAAGVNGSLKGCAADVDVAAGGECADELVAKKRVVGWGRREAGGAAIWRAERDAARRHERHIIVCRRAWCWHCLGTVWVAGWPCCTRDKARPCASKV